MMYQKYDAYNTKSTDEQWLLETPITWRVDRIKYEINLLTGYPFSSNLYTESGIKLVRGINVKESTLDWRETVYWPMVTTDLERFLLKADDILIGMDGSKVGKNFCQVNINDLPLLLLQRVARLRVTEKLDARFLYWNIASIRFLTWINKSKTDPMIPHLAPKDIKDFLIAYPPLNEQKNISTFLDKKTVQIDQAIAIKEQQIALLNERKQIVIQQAVTKGLDPNVKMKDSGVEWIGEIPEHWEIFANRAIFSERNESGRDGLPLLSVSIHTGVSDEEMDEDTNVQGRVKIEDKSKYISVKKGDIAFNMMRAWQGAIGAVSVDGMVSPAYIVAKPTKRIDANFFEYQYRCPEFIQQMGRYSKGITDFRKRLYWDGFKQLSTLVPPISEQLKIIEFIKALNIQIETVVSVKTQQIQKLKEYKTTLINDAVTGKIKVA